MSRPSLYPDTPAVTSFERSQHDVDQEALVELDSLSLREFLDHDSRPTFVLDLDSDVLDYSEAKNGIRPVFCNTALRLHDRLLENVTGPSADMPAIELDETIKYEEFKSWATGVTPYDDSRDIFPITMIYSNLLWTGSTIRRRWRVISGNQCHGISFGDLRAPPGLSSITNRDRKLPAGIKADDLSIITPPLGSSLIQSDSLNQSLSLVPPASPRLPRQRSEQTSGGTSSGTLGSGASVTLSKPVKGCPDWTAANPKGELSDHMLFARSVDWATTPLGPMSTWSLQFREIANLVMNNLHPVSLFWGEELTMLYNEAYKNEVAGNKHPDLMGTGFSGPFSELWDGVAPIFQECARTGTAVRKENDRLPIERYGYLEETFFSWSFVPVYGGTDRILGFYNGPFETTYQMINSRRLQTLRLLGEKLAQTRSVKHFWKCVLEGLEENHYDIPFALLYSIVDSDDADTASHSSDSTISLKSCVLEGSLGIPDGHPAKPTKLDLKRSIEGFVPAFREAMRTREPTMLHTRNGSLPEELIDGIQWRVCIS